LSASHSTSIGDMMSPVINTLSFQMPRAVVFLLLCGTSSAAGLPFLVMTSVSPVRSTSSISARHLALNSEVLIIRDMGGLGVAAAKLPSDSWSHDHGHVARKSINFNRGP